MSKRALESRRTTDFLNRLLDTHKLRYRDQGREQLLTRRNYEQNPFYNVLRNGYSALEREGAPGSETQLDLADFIMDRLPRLENYHGGLDYMGLRRPLNAIRYYKEHPFRGEPTDGEYDPRTAIIKLYPHEMRADNPLLTLLHEGTHGLDHLFMRTYQLPAVAALDYAQQHRGPHSFLPDILEGTRSILGDPSFNNEFYSYKSFFKPDIQKSLEELSPPLPAPPINNFYGAREKLFDLRKQHAHPPTYPFGKLSELTAYGTENLPHRWAVNAGTNPYSARLMHNMMSAEYQKFGQLGLTPTEHPGITRAFDDRLAQLRGAMPGAAPQAVAPTGGSAAAASARPSAP